VTIQKFTLNTDLRAGEGAATLAVGYAGENGAQRVCVILDSGLSGNEHARKLIADLEAAVGHVQVLESDAVEPTYDYLDEFRRRPEPELDLMIGIGGGSTLDLAKAVSVLVTNPGPAISYRGFDLIKEPGVPLIAIPTTAGTGSEVTPNAVFTDSSEMRKFGINTSLYLPRLALLDPLMTLSCPREPTISSGIDALVHSTESFVAKGGTDISRVYSRGAFRLIIRNLPVVVEHPDDVEARLRMQLAAFFAGAALMNAGAGPAGALSYPIGVHHKVPHGIAGGVFLAPVAEWNLERGATAYAGLADLLPEPPPAGASEEEKSADVVVAIRALVDRLDVPQTLTVFGIGEEDVPELVEQTFLLEPALLQNPVHIDREALGGLIGSMTRA
jgi:alcohol dehydrogenase